MPGTWKIEVRGQRRGWGVYGVDLTTGSVTLLEGGFFARAAASRARDEWERECLNDEVAAAERAAGWDPNP